MFTINVKNECCCFKKSSYDNNMQFDNLDIIPAIQNQGIINDYKS